MNTALILLAVSFFLVCHTIAINIVIWRHRNDAPLPKHKRKIVSIDGAKDTPIFITQGGKLSKD